jgi:hypothetical protein
MANIGILTIHKIIEAANIRVFIRPLHSHPMITLCFETWALATGKSITGALAPYHHEHILIVSFVPPHPSASSDELPKMRFVMEFVDSAFFYAEERSKAKLREEEQQKIEFIKGGEYRRHGRGETCRTIGICTAL